MCVSQHDTAYYAIPDEDAPIPGSGVRERGRSSFVKPAKGVPMLTITAGQAVHLGKENSKIVVKMLSKTPSSVSETKRGILPRPRKGTIGKAVAKRK